MSNKPLNFQPLPYPQTPHSAKAWFMRHGINRSEWARHFQLNNSTVTHLLRGRYKGWRGDAHRAAVLLGLKEQIQEPPHGHQ